MVAAAHLEPPTPWEASEDDGACHTGCVFGGEICVAVVVRFHAKLRVFSSLRGREAILVVW